MTQSKNSYLNKLEELSTKRDLDPDVWVGEFYPLLFELMMEVDEADESILAYFYTQALENDVSNGGFAQALINREWPSENALSMFEDVKTAYTLLEKSQASELLDRVIALANQESQALQAIKEASDAEALDYLADNPFEDLSSEFDELMIPWTERADYVRQHMQEFKSLVN